MLLARATAATAVLAAAATASGPGILTGWPALILIGYLVALAACVGLRAPGRARLAQTSSGSTSRSRGGASRPRSMRSPASFDGERLQR